MNSPMKNMAYWKAKNNPTPAKQVDPVEEEKAQSAKAENEGQQIIGQVKRGEISQEEGNKQLKVLQDAQNKPQ